MVEIEIGARLLAAIVALVVAAVLVERWWRYAASRRR